MHNFYRFRRNLFWISLCFTFIFISFIFFICLQKQQEVILHISQCDAQLILPNAPAKELRRYVQGEYIYVPLKLENGCSSHVITAAASVFCRCRYS